MFEKFLKLKTKKYSNKGFTLIELLVVVAIIGILSSVVLASLNSAREKSKIALIKSTLKQLYSQAQINFTEYGSFINSNPSNTDLTCTGPGNNLGKIVQPLIDQGIIVKCFSFYSSSLGDYNRRFGATALIYDTNELKAWSVDENGVAKWDTTGVSNTGVPVVGGGSSMNWQTAINACSLSGGRLSSLEIIRALSHAWYQGSSNTTYNPVSFYSSSYWSSSVVLASNPYYQHMDNVYPGAMSWSVDTATRPIRCVR